MPRVGIRDVAAVAGVAVGTVSHYLNHPGKVSDEKAERIRVAIDKLGFVRNDSARQLRLGTSSSLAYIAPEISNPFFADIAEKVERRAAELGMTVLLANTRGDRQRADAYLEQFEQQHVRGILIGTHEGIEDRLARLALRGTPSVLLGRPANSPDQASISIDDAQGGRLAGRHLLEVGRRRIAFVGGPLSIRQIADRLSGASETVREQNGTLEVVDTTERTLEAGRAAGRMLLQRPPGLRPDGVFAANDLLALGLLQALVGGGVRVPEDIALVGFDDIPFSESSLVPITTLKPPHEEYGGAAVDLLMAVVSGSPGERHRVYVPQLLVRASTVGFATASYSVEEAAASR
jgi:LacI family transcriptional regulator